MQFEARVVTFQVDATDIRGKEMVDTLNDFGRSGWEPWQMFTSAAAGAWKFPGIDEGKVYVAVWFKRAIPNQGG